MSLTEKLIPPPEVDESDHVDGAVYDVEHALERGIAHRVVYREELGLAGKGQAEDRKAFQDSRRPPVVELVRTAAPLTAEQARQGLQGRKGRYTATV